MVAVHPFNWHSLEAIFLSLTHHMFTSYILVHHVSHPDGCKRSIYDRICIDLSISFLCLHPTLVGPGKERPPNEAISCNARHLARPFWSLSNASWIAKKAWRKEWKATKCEWTIAFFSAISILGLNLDSAKYSFQPYNISFCRWHRFSKCQCQIRGA